MLIVLALAVTIGISLGLLGGGGSILAVPVLTYGAGLEPKVAIAASLLVVGTTSLFALVPHAVRKSVEWKTGIIFSLTAMTGAYLGGRAAIFFDGDVLLLLFAGMMVVTSVAMVRKKGEGPDENRRGVAPLYIIVAEGLAVGGATGLVGAGGGFLVVPALVLLGGMEMHKAIGTSLLVITLKSFSAFAGHAAHVPIDYTLVGMVTVSAVLGSMGGALLSAKISAGTLRRVFAWFVVAMAGFVVYREANLLAACLLVAVTVGAMLYVSSQKEGGLNQSA